MWSRPEQQLFIGESPAVQAEVIPGTSPPLIADVCRSVLISAVTAFLSRVGKRLLDKTAFHQKLFSSPGSDILERAGLFFVF